AHPPVGEVEIHLPLVREEERRRVFLGLVRIASALRLVADRFARERDVPQPSFFSLVTAVSADVLARPLLDADGLIAPRWARARVHAADVLQRVGRTTRPLNIHRLAIFEIGHRSKIYIVVSWKFTETHP